jgi:O-antigen/teichoic acid export membrane protein
MLNRTLRQRATSSAAWTAIGSLAAQGIRFVGNLVMARLLVPDAFGVMAIAWTTMTGLSMISDAGVRQNIVQSIRGDDPKFLNTGWSVQIARGVILTLAALLIAALFGLGQLLELFAVGTVYAQRDLPLVLAVVAFTALVAGFESTKVATASRHLALKRVVQIELVSQIVGVAVMISWAQFSRTVWALVFGGLVSCLVRVVLGHAILPGQKNAWHFDLTLSREILHFAKWILLSSLLEFAAANGDRIVLGGVISSNHLGQYALAALMIGAVQLPLLKTANVTLPILSEIHREDPHRLREMFYRLRLPVDVIALFLAGLLFSIGSWITGMIYDSRYHLVGPIVQILALLLIETRYETAIQYYLALGKPRLIVPIKLLRVMVLYIATPIVAQRYGLYGASWAIVIASLAGIPVHLFLLYRMGLLNLRFEILVLPSLCIGWIIGEWFLR